MYAKRSQKLLKNQEFATDWQAGTIRVRGQGHVMSTIYLSIYLCLFLSLFFRITKLSCVIAHDN